ncbi:MAG: phospholipase D-like domain-containing protein [Myxococcota bacterium]|nr:phospholipase D-like domain-containing protein [Myxococcota bacterium]
MANQGIRGTVVLQGTTTGISGLIVRVFDADGMVGEDGEDYLGEATTASDGKFEVTYSRFAYGVFEFKPDLVVRVYDPFLRMLYEHSEKNVTDTMRVLVNPIALVPNDASGLLPTNAMRALPSSIPKGTPRFISPGNKVRFYLDNEQLWKDFIARIRSATTSINVTQLITEPEEMIAQFPAGFDPQNPPLNQAVPIINISDELKKAATQNNVTVRMVLSFPDDVKEPQSVAGELVRYVQGKLESVTESLKFFQGSTVQMRKFKTSIVAPMHAKMAIIDGSEAWLFGSPFTQQAFDTPEHKIKDARRGVKAFGSSAFGVLYPFHDVSARIVGPAVQHLDETFGELWAQSDGSGSAYTPIATAPAATLPAGENSSNWVDTPMQVLRTLTGNRTGYFKEGETSVLEGYQRAISGAQKYIYIEDQYLWAEDLYETIKQALKKSNGPDVILVGNLSLDVPGYQERQENTLKSLKAFAAKVNASHRLGIYTVWLHEPGASAGSKSRIQPLYIHTKVAIVDDTWATVGSANTDGNSLNVSHTGGCLYGLVKNESDYASKWGPPVQHAATVRTVQPQRNVEVNVALFNGFAGQPASQAPQKLREALWMEHLGVTGGVPSGSGNWVKVWQDKADAKLAGLKAKPPTVSQYPRALPFKFRTKPKCYLKALDVSTRAVEIVDEFPDFDLKKGKWT